MPTTHYLGYPTHLDWLTAIDRRAPIQAISIIQPGVPNRRGLSLNKQVIVLTQLQGHMVHYLRLVTDAYQSLDGTAAIFDGPKHQHRSETAWHIIQAWLAEENLTIQRALIAFPKNYRYLDGHADTLMRYDRDLDGWYRCDRIDPDALIVAPRPTAAALVQGA